MKKFIFLCKQIWGKQSVTRAFYNERLRNEKLSGSVIDVGGGKDADYLSFMLRSDDIAFKTFDVRAGAVIDFEKDRLPAENDLYDMVLFLNVLEHIYNYHHIMSEIIRITKKDGRIIGIVPFLMWYHPDPKDYFRYTNLALEKIIAEAGGRVKKMENIARGPFTAAAQMIVLSIPRLLRVPVFSVFYFLDSIFLLLRPDNGSRYVLGYYFEIVPLES